MEIYTVKQGDTIASIAQSFGITPEQIINTNLITNPDNLVVGQDLIILIPQITHIVSPGETLASIAKVMLYIMSNQHLTYFDTALIS